MRVTDIKQHLMEKLDRVQVTALLGMLYTSSSSHTSYHEGPADDINSCCFGSAENTIVLTLVKQLQITLNFA